MADRTPRPEARRRGTPRDAALEQDVARYLATGHSDPTGAAYPARDLLDAMKRYSRVLRQALLAEVRRRAAGRRSPRLPPGLDPRELVRARVTPMIAGLFPAAEREVVLAVAERSIAFLTRRAALAAIAEASFADTSWNIANIFLGSLGAPTLDGEPAPLGLSEHTTCYVSLAYFTRDEPFADYVVHEVAHIFHNCKRETIGLRYTRHREWLLPIAFRKRETFAYACEAFSRILARAGSPAERRALLHRYGDDPRVADEAVDEDELLDILGEAVAARNGWKRILRRCAAKMDRRPAWTLPPPTTQHHPPRAR